MTIALEPWQLALLDEQRVAHLATVGDDGPAVVPVVFAWDGAQLYTPLDGKPKRAELTQLRRVRDILARPQAALVVDRYDEDWSRLAWLQLRGPAELLSAGPAYDAAIALLAARYPQYAGVPLAGRPLITIRPTTARSWRA